MNGTKIGYISACIAFDHRYTSVVEVYDLGEESCKAIVVRLQNSAVSGMDGPGNAHGFEELRRREVPRKAKDILDAVKELMDDTIKRYGKPTKEFRWVGSTPKGLSVARVANALNEVHKVFRA